MARSFARRLALPLTEACLAAALFLGTGCGARTALELANALSSNDASLASDAGSRDATAVSCVTETLTLTEATPVLMLALDRSGSMGGHLGTTNGTESRWEIVTEALASSLPSVNATMEIGALLFPSSSGGFDCAVSTTADLAPATGHVPALLALMQATTPGGATPTAAAIEAAAGQLQSERAATSARALVLATDGAPNCDADLDPTTCTCGTGQGGCRGVATMCLDEAHTVSTIESVAATGIPTYVIGIEDSQDAQFADVLNAMAIAGGRPNSGATSYYPGGSEADIDDALVAIRNQVGACTYLTSSVPNAGGTLVLTVNGATVPYDATGANGWSWADRNNGQIVLAGSACSTVASSTSASVSATVTCGAVDGGGDAR